MYGKVLIFFFKSVQYLEPKGGKVYSYDQL